MPSQQDEQQPIELELYLELAISDISGAPSEISAGGDISDWLARKIVEGTTTARQCDERA